MNIIWDKGPPPKTGVRILAEVKCMHFVDYGYAYKQEGTRIVEVWYHDNKWDVWAGTRKHWTTDTPKIINWCYINKEAKSK